jgi:adenine-specific DNA-methyltransferase
MTPPRKRTGRVYTPGYLVDNVLDLCGYTPSPCILKKHVIDNSCGDGAFVGEIVRRYCEVALLSNFTPQTTALDLSSYIHGVEIDPGECAKCRENASKVAADFGIFNVDWDIICANALTVEQYNGKMDFVIGNPPYVRIHNLADNRDDVKRFAKNGAADLYLAFYQVGYTMLSNSGTLAYIIPNSFCYSQAASDMRESVVCASLGVTPSLKSFVDLKHFQPFPVSVRVVITVFTTDQNVNTGYVDYYEYDTEKLQPVLVSRLKHSDYVFSDKSGVRFNFGDRRALSELHSIYDTPAVALCKVKNGFTTLLDDFFIRDSFPFTDYTIPVIQASTGLRKTCFYPYDASGKVIPYETLINNPHIRRHYDVHADALKTRSLAPDSPWWGFGRIQGINDVHKQKYSVSDIIKGPSDLKITFCEPGTGVYGKLYILTDLSLDALNTILATDGFIRYIALLGNLKSGGYYTFSAADLSRYLNFKLAALRCGSTIAATTSA